LNGPAVLWLDAVAMGTYQVVFSYGPTPASVSDNTAYLASGLVDIMKKENKQTVRLLSADCGFHGLPFVMAPPKLSEQLPEHEHINKWLSKWRWIVEKSFSRRKLHQMFTSGFRHDVSWLHDLWLITTAFYNMRVLQKPLSDDV